MKNFAILFFVTVLIVALTGCGLTNEASATAQCNLSTLKIKSVKIEGDRDGFVTRAIQSELYKRGARVDEKGIEVIGVILFFDNNTPASLSTEISSMSFASVASNTAPLAGIVDGSRILARRMVADFCECSTATIPSEKHAAK